jgi:carboxypeptidase Taq
MTAYDDLMAYDRARHEALAQVAGRLSWDQETMMPRAAPDQRAEEMGAMEAMLHARRTDPQGRRLAGGCRAAGRTRWASAQLREIRRAYARAVKVPAIWPKRWRGSPAGRKASGPRPGRTDDMAQFAPVLAEVVKLRARRPPPSPKKGRAPMTR